MKGLFFVHLLSSLMMVGIIWFVQIVHYPLFHQVGQENFTAFEGRHVALTGYLIAPLMLVEIGTAFLLLGMHEPAISSTFLWINAALLVLIWASTFFIQVPLHESLSQEYSTTNIQKLVNSNWIRTVLWSIRGGLLIGLMYGK
ncbi:MAG: hypothetical protein AAFY71_06395 [Bacteroidota bacterium]